MKTNKDLGRTKSGGRPRKFAEASRPITLTLPESTLRELKYIDPDPGHAIVKLTGRAFRSGGQEKPLVEILEMSPDRGLVVIGPSQALLQLPFLQLVEIAPARYLLALDSGHDFKHLEIAINDVLDDVPPTEKRERELIEQLLQHIKALRKSERTSTAEILFVRSPKDPRSADHPQTKTAPTLLMHKLRLGLALTITDHVWITSGFL